MGYGSKEGTREQYMKQSPIFKATMYLLLEGPVTQQRVLVHFVLEFENLETQTCPSVRRTGQTAFPSERNKRIELSSLAGAVVWCL